MEEVLGSGKADKKLYLVSYNVDHFRYRDEYFLFDNSADAEKAHAVIPYYWDGTIHELTPNPSLQEVKEVIRRRGGDDTNTLADTSNVDISASQLHDPLVPYKPTSQGQKEDE